MFLEELKRLKDQKKLVSLFSNETDSNKFAVGYITAVNEKNIIVISIAPNGKYDGLFLKKTEDIYKLEIEGRYIDKLMKLISINQTEKDILLQNIDFQSSDLIREILVFAKKNHVISSIELVDSGYDDCIGFVESINEDLCKIKEVDEYGEPDGLSTIKLSDITKISCDDIDDHFRKLLYESR